MGAPAGSGGRGAGRVGGRVNIAPGTPGVRARTGVVVGSAGRGQRVVRARSGREYTVPTSALSR